MTKGRDLTPRGAPPAADARDGERREVRVRPEDVWQPGPPPPRPRWSQRSFFAPILRVVAISALLLYGVLAIGGAAWAWLQ